jgi:outer membrane protein TolC
MIPKLLSVFFLLIALNLGAQNAMSLQQAIDYALKNGYSVQNASSDIEIARKKVTELRGIGIPQLSADGAYQNFIEVPVSVLEASAFNPGAPPGTYLRIPFGVKHNMSYGYTASWLAFNGEYLVGLQASKAYVDLSKTNLRKSEIEVKESVTRAYQTVLVLYENKRILNENIASLEKSIAQTEAFYREGFIEELDVDRLKLLKQTLSITLSTLEEQTALAEKLLKFNMGYEVNTAIELSDKLNDHIEIAKTGVDAIPTFDIKSNIDNILLDQALNLQKLELKRQQSAFLPTLSTFYSWKESRITNEGDKLFDPMFRVPGGTLWGVNLGVPIFKGLSQRSRVQQARLNMQKLETTQKQARQGLELQAAQSYTTYATALKNYNQSKESVALAQRILDRAQIKFKEGIGSSIELIQSENDLLNAQASFVETARQLLDSRVSLDKNLNKF